MRMVRWAVIASVAVVGCGTIYAYRDVIELTAKAKEMARVIESTQSAERDVPEYVTADHKEMKGTFVRGPKLADVPYPVQMEPSLVVEYYSR